MTAFINLNEPLDDTKEIAKWLGYHHCTPMAYPGKTGPTLAVNIPLTCKHLTCKDGVYSCNIHETRPKVCRDYFCPRAK